MLVLKGEEGIGEKVREPFLNRCIVALVDLPVPAVVQCTIVPTIKLF